MSTIRDIAKLAGVSKSTVSNVLNDRRSRFSEGTRQRVLEAIDILKYRPNAVARSLVLKNTRTIGVIMSDITRIPYVDALRTAEKVFAKHEFNVIVSNTNRSYGGEKKRSMKC